LFLWGLERPNKRQKDDAQPSKKPSIGDKHLNQGLFWSFYWFFLNIAFGKKAYRREIKD